MSEFGGLDRHAVARQHVEMRSAGKGVYSGFDGQKGGFDKAPLSPAAFGAAGCEGDGGIGRQAFTDLVEIGLLGAAIKVDRHEITRRRQTTRLGDNPFGILVTEENVSDSCHFRNS